MRAATFGPTAVELGGHDAPEQATSGPTRMSRAVLWSMAVVILGACTLILLVGPSVMRGFQPKSQRIAVGNVSFLPAAGWSRVANPDLAPAGAVTVGKDGATFTIWTQPGENAGGVAHQVTAEFFPEAADSGVLLHETALGLVRVRPKQNQGTLQISEVAVGPVDARSMLGLAESNAYPGQLVVEVSAGPPPGRADNANTLLGDVGKMAATVESRSAS